MREDGAGLHRPGTRVGDCDQDLSFDRGCSREVTRADSRGCARMEQAYIDREPELGIAIRIFLSIEDARERLREQIAEDARGWSRPTSTWNPSWGLRSVSFFRSRMLARGYASR